MSGGSNGNYDTSSSSSITKRRTSDETSTAATPPLANVKNMTDLSDLLGTWTIWAHLQGPPPFRKVQIKAWFCVHFMANPNRASLSCRHDNHLHVCDEYHNHVCHKRIEYQKNGKHKVGTECVDLNATASKPLVEWSDVVAFYHFGLDFVAPGYPFNVDHKSMDTGISQPFDINSGIFPPLMPISESLFASALLLPSSSA